jgi:hypothetical protein
MKKAITLLILTASLIFGAWHLGIVEPLYQQDLTYITYLVTLLWLTGIALALRYKDEWASHVANALPGLGLLGTLIGIKIAVTGSAGEDFSLRDLGVSSAINTTILGLIGNMYLVSFMKLLRRERSE